MNKQADSSENVDKLIDKFGVKQVIEMFDLMPDILFWVKDDQCRWVYANQHFLSHLKVNSLLQIISCSDVDYFAPHIAKQFIVDDHKVMNGEVVNNRLEMNYEKSGEVAWFTTSKRALYDENGKVIGSYGITRHLEKTSRTLSAMDALKIPVKYVRDNYMKDLCVQELAQISHLSISALERRFKKYLVKTPKQFINEVRLDNGRRLLVESNDAIANIANDVGFTDHSYFSRQFKLLFSELPSTFRQAHMKKK